MDAVEDLSPACRALREIRSSDRCRCAVTGQQALEPPLMPKEYLCKFNHRPAVNESDSINNRKLPRRVDRLAIHRHESPQGVVELQSVSRAMIEDWGDRSCSYIFS